MKTKEEKIETYKRVIYAFVNPLVPGLLYGMMLILDPDMSTLAGRILYTACMAQIFFAFATKKQKSILSWIILVSIPLSLIVIWMVPGLIIHIYPRIIACLILYRLQQMEPKPESVVGNGFWVMSVAVWCLLPELYLNWIARIYGGMCIIFALFCGLVMASDEIEFI